jgi:putative ABC transport system permease protein
VTWLSVRELLAHPRRAVLTGVAVVVGVALVSGTLILGDTAVRAGVHDSDVDQLRRILLVAGGVALLVGAFIINTTISTVLAQRTRELALLRCLGAEPRQLRRMVRGEALAVGVVASLMGLVVGLGVAATLRAYVSSALLSSGDLPSHTLVVTPRTVAVALLTGTVVMVVSAQAPARRASRAAPLAALRGLPATGRRRRRAPQMAAGAVLTSVGVAAVPFAAVTGTGPVLLPAAALTLAGVRLLGPWAAAPLVRLVGLPVARVLRLPGALARINAMRSPDRTAATASALMVGLALVSFVTVLFTSTKAFLDAEVARTPAFTVISGSTTSTGKQAGSPVADGLLMRLAALPELSAVVPTRSTLGTAAGTEAEVTGVDLNDFARVRGLDVTAGSLADVSRRGLWVVDDVAADHGWTVGSRVPVNLGQGSRTFTLRAVYRHESYVSTSLPRYLLGSADYAALGGDTAVGAALLRVADGVAPATARAAVDRAVAALPGLVVEDRAQVRRETVGQVAQAASLYLALTCLAVLVGLVGIVNAMSLSVVDRVRELGLLRAVGMDRRALGRMVRAEAFITGCVGAVLGIGTGTLFGWGAAKVFEHSSAPTRFTAPVAVLALVAAVAAAAGVVAAALPARSASRVDVLRAIAAE